MFDILIELGEGGGAWFRAVEVLEADLGPEKFAVGVGFGAPVVQWRTREAMISSLLLKLKLTPAAKSLATAADASGPVSIYASYPRLDQGDSTNGQLV